MSRRKAAGRGAERFEPPDPDAHDLPPGGAQRSVLASVDLFAASDVFETVAADRVVLDGDPELGEDEVGPHFEVIEERAGDPDGVEALGEGQPVVQVGAHAVFDR